MRNALRQMFGPLLSRLPLGRHHRVGLHLGGERLNVAQMRETASGLAFRAAASVDIGCTRDEILAQPRRLKQVVKRVWAEYPFSGRDVVACMPHDQLKVFSVSCTAAEGQSDAQATARGVRERMKAALDLTEQTAKQLLLKHGFAAAPGAAGNGEFSAALKEVLRPQFLALKAEVSKTLIYAASKTRGETVDKIFLVGGVARCPGIAELMSQDLSKPVEVLNPFSIFPHRLT